MKIIAINGSPRKGWNTHTLLEKALAGAESQGAETEMIHLYDLNCRGCLGCLACKRRAGSSIGRCAVQDDLQTVLGKIAACDGLLLGSPIYIGEVTAAMRALIERLTFQYITYTKDVRSYYSGKLPTGFLYTMNAPETVLDKVGYTAKFEAYRGLMERLLDAPSRDLLVTETWQVEDYSQFTMNALNEEDRRQRRTEVFPQDCQKAFDFGVELVRTAIG